MIIKISLSFLVLLLLFINCLFAQNSDIHLKLKDNGQTENFELLNNIGGKKIAPVIDIQPQLRGFHDYSKIQEEINILKNLGFERIYFVLCQPGYSAFSDPTISIMPTDKGTGNHTLESILALGDPNWAYMYETKRQGMEAWAIIKPYESGTGFTIPHGAMAPLSRKKIETIGGQHIHFDNLISDNPDLRIKRKPLSDSILKRLNEPIKALEIAFCLDYFKQKTSSKNYFEFQGLKNSEIQIPEITLWISQDNGRYVKYEGNLKVSSAIKNLQVIDANGFLINDTLKRFLVINIKDLKIPDDHNYIAITLDKYQNLYTIPYSMIRVYASTGEIPITTGIHVRNSLSPIERNKTYEKREWGLETRPVTGDVAGTSFMDWGFEFEFQGTGHWGDGWVNSPVYGIAKGKRMYMAGTPCEAYPEVQDYWLEQVERVMAMGYDGIDFRLQNHSGMVTDYINYGYNEPIINRYHEKFGVDILKEEVDPLKIMEIRGEYFLSFLEKAANVIHSNGKKMQVHLRHAHESPQLSDDFNGLGFWAMPKILLDWKKAIDLADEVTIKHYYHGNYRSWMGDSIKTYVNNQGKRVWVHNYFTQGDGINYDFFRAIEKDERIGGILLYEVNEGLLFTGFPEPIYGINKENVGKLNAIKNQLDD
jgi:hypothetical protein